MVVVIARVLGASDVDAYWRFSHVKKVNDAAEVKGWVISPLTSSRSARTLAGLTGFVARRTRASAGAVLSQRSDVVKIMHVDPAKGTVPVLTSARDTVVTPLARQSIFGKFNRLDVNFQNGATHLTWTITAIVGIPIAQTIVVSFAGIINAADAIGVANVSFPYPAKDAFSGPNFTHARCENITNFQARAEVRRRDFQGFHNGAWNTDVTSDYGRKCPQNELIKAVIAKAKGLYGSLTINLFMSKVPSGIALDSNFSVTELVGLVVKFHPLDPSDLLTSTLPTTSGSLGTRGSVLFVEESAMEVTLE